MVFISVFIVGRSYFLFHMKIPFWVTWMETVCQAASLHQLQKHYIFLHILQTEICLHLLCCQFSYLWKTLRSYLGTLGNATLDGYTDINLVCLFFYCNLLLLFFCVWGGRSYHIPPLSFASHGTLVNMNTIEDFRNCDKLKLLKSQGHQVCFDFWLLSSD